MWFKNCHIIIFTPKKGVQEFICCTVACSRRLHPQQMAKVRNCHLDPRDACDENPRMGRKIDSEHCTELQKSEPSQVPVNSSACVASLLHAWQHQRTNQILPKSVANEGFLILTFDFMEQSKFSLDLMMREAGQGTRSFT